MNKSLYFTATEFPESEFEGLTAFSKAQIAEIKRKTPISEIEEKEDEDGFKYKTVKGSYIKKKLNLIFGWNWDFQIINREYYSSCQEALVHGRLTIRSQNQTVIKEQFGKYNVKASVKKSGNRSTFAPNNIGNAFKSAATDSLKKCASEIGLCWDIYSQDIEEPNKEVIASESHQEQKITEKLDHFLNLCKSFQDVEDTVETFLLTGKLNDARDNLIRDYKLKFQNDEK